MGRTYYTLIIKAFDATPTRMSTALELKKPATSNLPEQRPGARRWRRCLCSLSCLLAASLVLAMPARADGEASIDDGASVAVVVPIVVTVTNTDSSGPGSLDQAIADTNPSSGPTSPTAGPPTPNTSAVPPTRGPKRLKNPNQQPRSRAIPSVALNLARRAMLSDLPLPEAGGSGLRTRVV